MAIQVGGTTVINNSRALSNIASVDATTAASIEAAGVGGGFTESTIALGPSSSLNAYALVGADWLGTNTAVNTSAPPSGIIIAQSTICTSRSLMQLTIKSDTSKITFPQRSGYWSGGMTIWIKNTEKGANHYENVLNDYLFNDNLRGSAIPSSYAQFTKTIPLSIYGANSILYLTGGTSFATGYGGMNISAGFSTIDVLTGSL